MRCGLMGMIVLAVTIAPLGCSSNSGSGSKGPDGSATLFEVGGLISMYSGEFKRGPSKATDLQKYENAFPIGYQAIKSGEVVVIWGVKMVIEEGGGGSTSTEILAHEKNAPTAGGYVLLMNGKTPKMTAAEFAAAPKAKK